MVRLKT